jgi:hypothetical protein
VSELSTREVLVRARKLIENPERWTRGSFCDGAGRYCAAGSLLRQHLRRDPRSRGENPVLTPGYSELLAGMKAVDPFDGGFWTVPSWNDSHSHAEVLAAFDAAIAACEDPS